MHDTSYQMFGTTKKQTVARLSALIVGFLFMIATLVLVSINLSVTYQINSNVSDDSAESPVELPKAYGAHTPGTVRDQQNRGTCWDFATMRFLEDIYRIQGIQRGYLEENQFVRFSEQAHGINLINFCEANPSKCPDTPQSTGIATDGYPSWIYHF